MRFSSCRRWIVSSLLAGALTSSCVANLSSGAETLGEQRVAAEDLVAKALRAEVEGKFDHRINYLREAESVYGELPAVHWQQGLVYFGREGWVSIEQAVDLYAKRKNLNTYENRRRKLKDTVQDHFEMVKWCAANKLGNQARAHLERIIQIDPDNSVAREGLGHQRVGDNWFTPEMVARMVAMEEVTKESVRRFRPQIELIFAGLKSSVPAEQKKARTALSEFKDPLAIPAMTLFGQERGVEEQLEVVQWLSSIKVPASSSALVEMAVYSSFERVCNAASVALRERSIQEYVPAIMQKMECPLQSSVVVIYNPNGSVRGYRRTIVKEGVNEDEVVNLDIRVLRMPILHFEPDNVGPSGQSSTNIRARSSGLTSTFPNFENYLSRLIQEREIARKTAMEVEQQQRIIERDRAIAVAFNRRLCEVLTEATGEEFSGDPKFVWAWWAKQNELALSDQRKLKVSGSYDERIHQLHIGTNVTYDQFSNSSPQSILAFLDNQAGSLDPRTHECFVAGTPVVTHDGLKSIESIMVGDMVLSKNTVSGELAFKPVLRCTVRTPEPTVLVEAEGEKFQCTGGHQFWVSGRGWTKARHLIAGDVIHGAEKPCKIVRIEDSQALPTFNLEVADFSNYFVGESMLLTHDVTVHEPTAVKVPGLAYSASQQAPQK